MKTEDGGNETPDFRPRATDFGYRTKIKTNEKVRSMKTEDGGNEKLLTSDFGLPTSDTEQKLKQMNKLEV